MKLPSNCRKVRSLILLPVLLAATACNGQGKPAPLNIAVSVADASVLSRPMPGGSIEALTDPVAHARDDAKIERWGMEMAAAWGRVCRAIRDQGVEVSAGCPNP